MAETRSPELARDRGLPYHVRLDEVTEESVTVAVIEAIAAVEGVSPVDVDVRLYDYLDLEALDDLFSHASRKGNAMWTMEFSVEGYDVTVHDDGAVTVA